jgi:hypothetical protein
MDYNAVRELQHELVYRLKRELTFYRSLYVLIERQRSAASGGADDKLAVSYAELGTIMGGLRESQFAISEMRKKEPTLFLRATQIPPVPQLVKEAEEILTATRAVLEEGAKVARDQYARLQVELGELTAGHRALRSQKGAATAGRRLDGSVDRCG